MKRFNIRWAKGLAFTMLSLVSIALLSACSSNPGNYDKYGNSLAQANTAQTASNSFSFNMIPSNAAIKACLPKAQGYVTVTPGSLNDVMTIKVNGLAPKTEYDLFVTELPGAPFGVAWYQTDIETDANGNGSATVRGIFDVETFSVSVGGPTTTFKPVHQYHLGLWFNDPKVPFQLGCEPGKTQPVVTPFNGEQHAGIQVLNTGNFPNNAGPLSQVHR